MFPAPTKPTGAPASSSAREAMPGVDWETGVWWIVFVLFVLVAIGADDPKVLRSRGER
jgi:hypothetical protein